MDDKVVKTGQIAHLLEVDIKPIKERVGLLQNEIGDKVEKEVGKGLSTNDFTDNHKNIVDALSAISIENGKVYIAI